MPSRDDLRRFATKVLIHEGTLTHHCEDCVAAFPHREHREMVFVSTPVSDDEYEADTEADGWWETDDLDAEFDAIAREWLRERLGVGAETLRSQSFYSCACHGHEIAEAVLALLDEEATDG